MRASSPGSGGSYMHLHTKGSPTTSRAASSCSSRSLGDRSTASPQRSGKELLPRAATGKAASYAAMFASGGAACLASERAQHHQSAPRSTAYTSTVAFAAAAAEVRRATLGQPTPRCAPVPSPAAASGSPPPGAALGQLLAEGSSGGALHLASGAEAADRDSEALSG